MTPVKICIVQKKRGNSSEPDAEGEEEGSCEKENEDLPDGDAVETKYGLLCSLGRGRGERVAGRFVANMPYLSVCLSVCPPSHNARVAYNRDDGNDGDAEEGVKDEYAGQVAQERYSEMEGAFERECMMCVCDSEN